MDTFLPAVLRGTGIERGAAPSMPPISIPIKIAFQTCIMDSLNKTGLGGTERWKSGNCTWKSINLRNRDLKLDGSPES